MKIGKVSEDENEMSANAPVTDRIDTITWATQTLKGTKTGHCVQRM
jgi:hypothetical protein